jgi:hypothetical protein
MLDPDDYPPGPEGLVRLCEDRNVQLKGQRAGSPQSERRAINQQLLQAHQIFLLSRLSAGYGSGPTHRALPVSRGAWRGCRAD